MTWSIIALDEASGALGLVIVSRHTALGSLGPHGRGGVGLVVTQGMTDPICGESALAHVENGIEPARALEKALRGSQGPDDCQIHLIDASGRHAARTGSDCPHWCGHISGRHVSICGNGLPGPETVEATLEAFERGSQSRFGARLLRAVRAGEAAGGKGSERRSAALRIYGDALFPLLDLRVDDHADALNQMTAIYVGRADECIGFSEAVQGGGRGEGRKSLSGPSGPIGGEDAGDFLRKARGSGRSTRI
ncbi:MAG: DUF1028 domain-containing protein [Geminicoccaceae bacterium]